MMRLNRRAAMGLAGAGLLGSMRAGRAETVTLPFGNGERPLVQYPEKRPMLRLTSRPPQLETPFAVFNESLITPNDAFFVRYHLADIPLEIDPAAFRVGVNGAVEKPLQLELAELKRMDPVELVAVNQCSGNGRGFFEPRVAGGQAGNGLMGNARWHGVPLNAVLDRAGVKPAAVQVRFDGLDGPVMETTPDFVKALPIDHGARRRRHAGLGDERQRPALPQRLSAAPRRAGLFRHLLGQAPERDHGAGQAARQLLDGQRLSHPGQRLQLRRARHRAGQDQADRPLQGAQLHHHRWPTAPRSRPVGRCC